MSGAVTEADAEVCAVTGKAEAIKIGITTDARRIHVQFPAVAPEPIAFIAFPFYGLNARS
jgi:hypothetical protein